MKAVAYQQSHPIAHTESLLDVDLPEPTPGPRDLLVEVRAVAVNPVDTKMRVRAQPAPGDWKVLGWDASGIVRAVGSDVALFKPGDRVWYAGSLQRSGCNSELQVVDERIVGTAPRSLDFAAAAALPLTSITAWEMLFDRLESHQGKAITGNRS
jgi:zinc-binding alcohol dehydrogenase family protein